MKLFQRIVSHILLKQKLEWWAYHSYLADLDRSSAMLHVYIRESPADARVTRNSSHSKMAAVSRWPSPAILDIIEPKIAPFDPPTPKTFAQNQTWSGSVGCTVCEIFAFELYGGLETGVRGHSMSLKVAPAPFDRAHTTLYSSSIVTMPLSLTVSEI